MIKTCAFCGKEFKTNDKRQKYCSKKCYLDDRVVDLTGQKFGKLTVLGLGYKEPKKVYWLCECECGNKRYLTNGHLRTMVSCGCVMSEKQKNAKQNIYPYYRRLQSTFSKMRNRCYNPKNNRYYLYGQRGIKICDEWLNDFMNFYKWAIENNYEPGLTIERIDVNGNYCPENCCWIPRNEQSKNRRFNVMVTINDETRCLADWCTIFNKNPFVVYSRINKLKWNIIKALEVPIKHRIKDK